MQRLRERCEGGLGAEAGRAPPLGIDELPSAEGIVEQDLAEGSHMGQALRGEERARAAQRLPHRPAVVGHDGHPRRHRLAERQPEALVLAHRDEEVGGAVTRAELVLADGAEEPELLSKWPRPRLDLAEVGRAPLHAADEDQSHRRSRSAPPELERQLDDILDLLVGGEAADEEEVRLAVAEPAVESLVARVADAPGLEGRGDDRDVREAALAQLTGGELAEAERGLDLLAQCGELEPAVVERARDRRIVRSEEPGRGDVVVR